MASSRRGSRERLLPREDPEGPPAGSSVNQTPPDIETASSSLSRLRNLCCWMARSKEETAGRSGNPSPEYIEMEETADSSGYPSPEDIEMVLFADSSGYPSPEEIQMAGDGRNGRWQCCCMCTNTPGGCVKVLVTCLLILTLTGALLFTKFAFFRLAVRINNPSNSTKGNVTDHVTTDPQQRVDFVRVMTMLTVVLMLPCALNVLRGLPAVLRGGPRGVESPPATSDASKVSQSCCKTTLGWFHKLSAPILESFGLTLFCFKVMPSYDFVTLLLLMMSVVILPTDIMKCRKMERKHIICKVTGSAMQLAALGIALYLAFMTSEPRYRFWHVIAALATLNLSWHLYLCLAPDLAKATATVPDAAGQAASSVSSTSQDIGAGLMESHRREMKVLERKLQQLSADRNRLDLELQMLERQAAWNDEQLQDVLDSLRQSLRDMDTTIEGLMESHRREMGVLEREMQQLSADRNRLDLELQMLEGRAAWNDEQLQDVLDSLRQSIRDKDTTIEREGDIKSEESVFAWQLSSFTNLIKLFCIPIFTFILFYLDNNLYDKDEWFKKVMLEDFQAAWHWGWGTETQLTLVLVFCGGLAYFLAFWAYQLCLARFTLMPAIVLSLGMQGIFAMLGDLCHSPLENYFALCKDDWSHRAFLISATILGIAGQLLSQWTQLCWECPIILQQESHVFYLPGLQLFALEQWLMRNRRCGVADTAGQGDLPETTVFICTTMYREAKSEMETLLKSIAKIDDHKWENQRSFESHVVLDCGVHGDHLTPFAVQLVSLLPSTLKVRDAETQDQDCQKLTTPYGLMLRWTLPKKHDHDMNFYIHLKDPLKVKRKKRWSQILYLNYILDCLLIKGNNTIEDIPTEGNRRTLENSYILVTDADVAFTPSAVQKLLDLMLRDITVGAACARMHPEGSGPLYWCQIFEYAVGHWFQKATEHILGSVLCAPGCFSVYRCQALRDVLPTYASNVDAAFDFLTKDMGEDRWLCTLMIQAGWRIDYCAAASCRTYCPEHVDEFFKQRRRWIASTLANLKLLLSQGMGRSKVQGQWFFKAYQGLLLISSIVSPALIILFVAGGLWYAWNVNTVAMVIVQVFVCAAFTLVCLKTSATVQINVAKLLVFLYAATMAMVAVGTAQEIFEDVKIHNVTDKQQYVTEEVVRLPLSTATIYLASISAMFLLTAVLHLPEFCCVISGFLYILVLPSFSIILNIYSLVNITDISWGTREDKMKSSVEEHKDPLYRRVWNGVTALFKPHQQQQQHIPERPRSSSPIASGSKSESGGSHEEPVLGENVKKWLQRIFTEGSSTAAPHDYPAFSEIGDKFHEHGFDNTVYISGMNTQELRDIGIHDLGHVNFLMKKIEELKSFEIDVGLPRQSVDEWLWNIGLAQYRMSFTDAYICKPEDMDVLKTFSSDNIRNELKIIKAGHIKRLQYAIKQLRTPTEEEEEAKKVKKHIQDMEAEELGGEEKKFWKDLVDKKLDPKPDTFRIERDLHGKLCKLRNSWLMILGVTNTLFLIVMTTLAAHLDLELLGTNPLGLLFLVVFGLVFAVQFVYMLLHRLLSLSHWLARAKCPCSNSQCMQRPRMSRGRDCESPGWCCCCPLPCCRRGSRTQSSPEQRSAEQRSAEQRSAEQRSAEQRSAEQRSAEQRSAEQRSAEQCRAAQSRGSRTQNPEKIPFVKTTVMKTLYT